MRPRRRETLILGGLAAVAALGGGVVGALLLQSGSGAAELLSAPLIDLGGRQRRLREWQGKALVCNFWATWCAPCREEIPLLVDAKERHRQQPLEFIGIALDKAEKIREFAAIFGINYPILIGDAGTIEVMRSLGNKGGGLPYTVALDRNGALVSRKLGGLRAPELEKMLADVLG